MIWRIILWGSLIWLPYLMYRVLGGEAKFTKNIVSSFEASGIRGLPVSSRKIRVPPAFSLLLRRSC